VIENLKTLDTHLNVNDKMFGLAISSLFIVLVGCGTIQKNQPLNSFDQHSYSYLDQGNIFLQQKRYQQAIEQFQLAIEVNPNSVMAHAGLGWAYYNNGMIDAAIIEGKIVMDLEPNHPDLPVLSDLINQLKKRQQR
tara:strand:+ start:23 stop:430 length:408 start_codon:yes stop_codon:yes gene_type:complete